MFFLVLNLIPRASEGGSGKGVEKGGGEAVQMFGDVYSACSTSFDKHTQVCTVVVYSFKRSARVKYLRDFKGTLYLITNQYGLEFFSVKKNNLKVPSQLQ